MCDNLLDRKMRDEIIDNSENVYFEPEEPKVIPPRNARDVYCNGPNRIGVRRYDGHIDAFSYMAEDGTIIHEMP